ncbi:GAF domain-containing protein [Catalinimonas alkaloidigena]|nr:GAF domain-containing protein [Catalinimonas alkaloidigena]
MREQVRLEELLAYKILDTSPEKELDELAEIASAVCGTPISLISFLDDTRQWFKARRGIDVSETPRSVSFCQHALHQAKEVLVIDDPLNDERFKANPFVQGAPYIRFYAGAPLETPNGNVLGTLCVIDTKPRKITGDQKKALMLLAKKAMDHLETRRLLIEQANKIESNAARLRKLTDCAPGAIYQFEMRPDGSMAFPFISKGMAALHPHLDLDELKANPGVAFASMHPDDIVPVQESIQESFRNLTRWNMEYRVITTDGQTLWHWANANPERKPDGTVVWYGTFQDITERKEYIKTLEQILFDISHKMRGPVATMLGLMDVINQCALDEHNLREYAGYIKRVSEEMDSRLRKLHEAYYQINLKNQGLTEV